MNDLWTIAWTDQRGRPSYLVTPVDSNPGMDDEGMLVYRSRESAENAARYQNRTYGHSNDDWGDAIAVPLPAGLELDPTTKTEPIGLFNPTD